jgi:exopolysaccharide production protein ExoQ
MVTAVAGLFFSAPFGSIPLYLSLCATIGFAVIAFDKVVAAVASNWVFLLFPTLCIVSTFWSDEPHATLRHSLELFLTFVMAMLICDTLKARTLVLTTLICCVILVLMCLPEVPDAIKRNWALVGVFGSKNAMGFTSHMTLFAGLCTLLLPGRMPLMRMTAAVAVLASLLTLWLARSAGANMYAGLSLFVLCLCQGYRLMPRRLRPVAVVTVAFGALLAAVAFPLIRDVWAQFQLDVLHKDTSLTGRTYLWSFAEQLIRERPWLGHGTFAFWIQGNIDAEGLWQRFDIASRTGFNFHNLFIETTVNNGYIGLAIEIVLLVVVGCASLFGFLRAPSAETMFVCRPDH